MPVITIDLDGVDENGGFGPEKVVPAGVYNVEVSRCEYDAPGKKDDGSKKWGGLFVNFKIVEGEEEGTELFNYMSMHPNALWRFKKELMVLGVDVTQDELDTEELIGAQATIKVVVADHYKGERDENGNIKKQNNVEEVLARSATGNDW